MTWGAVQTLGSGALDFRMVIEGYRYVFCTDGMTEGTEPTGGRLRVHGLKADGIRWSERQHFVEPIGKITGFRVDIVDVDGNATKAFTSAPSVVAYMDQESMTKSATSLLVTDPTGISVADHIHVGVEAMSVSSISGRTLNVTRGRWDTQAVAHSKQAGADRVEVEVTDVPILATGRRVWLYAHGRSESGVSDSGTLIYKGLVGREPTFDGTKWSLLVDPLTKILDQEIGVDRDNIAPRGIYYGADLRIVLKEHSTADRSSAVTEESRVILNGYYETQEAFLTQLQTYLDSATAGVGWDNTYTAIEEPNGQWTIAVDVSSGAPKFSQVMITSAVDGTTEFAMQNQTGFSVTTAAASSRIKPVWKSPILAIPEAAEDEEGDPEPVDITRAVRTVPRAHYGTGAVGVSVSPFFADMAEYGATPGTGDKRTVYLYGIEGATVGDTLSIDGKAFEIATINSATGKITVAAAPEDALSGLWCGSYQPDFGLTADVGGMTDFGDFLSTMVSQSLDRAAETGIPFFRSDDFDTTEIQAVVDEAKADLPPLQRRSYAFHEAKTLNDVISQELLAHGAYMYLTADWKLGARRIRSILNVAHDLTDPSNRAISEGFGTVELVPDVVNSVVIKTGYRIDEDGAGEHRGRTYKVREVRSQTRMRQRRVLEIAPEVVVATQVTDDEAQRMGMPYTTLLGHRYELYTLPVPLPFYGVLVGESVRFNAPQLAADGVRGVTNAVGLVVGKRWQPSTGSGELTLLRVLENVAGYAPSALVSGWTLDSGTTYDITTTNRYAASGNDASFFEAGFEVALVEWDTDGRKYRGTITDVSGTTISVEFQTALPSYSGRWTLGFEVHQDCTDAQRAYAFVADRFYRLSNGDAARVLGP